MTLNYLKSHFSYAKLLLMHYFGNVEFDCSYVIISVY